MESKVPHEIGYENWRGAPRPGPPPKKGRLGIVSVVGLGCVLIFLLVNLLREDVPGTALTEPPPEAVGRWTTTDARYAGRALLVGAYDIVLEVGPEGPPVHGEIVVVTRREEEGAPVIYIVYDTGEGPLVLEMILDAPNRMHLRNPKDVIWFRTP